MKVICLERVERKNAWSAKSYCYQCGAHEYELVEQVEPISEWYVRCPQCGAEGPASPARDIAIARWKQL